MLRTQPEHGKCECTDELLLDTTGPRYQKDDEEDKRY